MGKQLIPFPEYLTPLAKCDDPLEMFDVVAAGHSAFYIFDEQNEEIAAHFCEMDHIGGWDYDSLYVVPTVHCKECGQRMSVKDIPLDHDYFPTHIPEKCITYKCTCGMEFNKETGWTLSRGDQR